MNSTQPLAILFVCTANQMRSPVAEAAFREALKGVEGGSAWRIQSAGTWTRSGLRVSERICRLAQPLGVDLRNFKTTSVDDLDLGAFDWIAVMEKSHKEALHYEHPSLRERIVLLTALAGEFPADIPDPVSVDPSSALRILVDVRDLSRRAALRLAGGM